MRARPVAAVWAVIALCSVTCITEAQAGVLLQSACRAQITSSLVSLLLTSGNATASSNTSYLVDTALQQYGSRCLGVDDSATSIRVLVPMLPLYTTWTRRAAQFEAITGVRVVLEAVRPSEITSEILFQISSNTSTDGWIIDPSGLGALVQSNALSDLSDWVLQAEGLQFWDYIRFQRQVSAVYDKKTLALPLDGRLFLMYYRQDILAQAGVAVPRTWDELLAAARKLNGTDTNSDGTADLFGACFDIAPDCKGGYLLAAVAGPYIQSQGSAQGFWFDPDVAVPDLVPLVNTAGFQAALQFWRDILPYTNPVATCGAVNADFQQGRCAFTINWGEELHAAARNSLLNGTGVVGVSPLPGATKVYNRATGQLAACDQALCPMADLHTASSTGAPVWINTAPYPAFGGWMAGVSQLAPLSNQRRAFEFFAYLASPNNSWEDVLGPSYNIGPLRVDHLTDVDRWVAAGYPRQMVTSYLQATKTSFSAPNIFLDSRLAAGPSSPGYRALLDTALQNVTRSNGVPAAYQAIMQTLEVLFNQAESAAAYRYYGGDRVALAQQYWHLIGRQGSVEALIARRNQTSPPPPVPSTPSEGLSTTSIIVLAVVPTLACLVVAAVAMHLWLRSRPIHMHRGITGKVLPPGVGAQTTLVITDVQDSTTLFETLPVRVMDHAMKLACTIIRAHAHHHTGYECKTEGDSFTLAFHTARDAVMFCSDLQVALLHAPWPQELLSVKEVPSVHPKRVLESVGAQTSLQILRLAGSTVVTRVLNTFNKEQRASAPGAPILGKQLLEMMQQELVESVDDEISDEIGKLPAGMQAATILSPDSISAKLPKIAAVGVSAREPQTFQELLVSGWQPVSATRSPSSTGQEGAEVAQLVWSGLRVRCGVASGLSDPHDMIQSRDLGTTQYTGKLLATAKLMEACCHGGQVIMSMETFNLLEPRGLPDDVVVLHMGKYLIRSSHQQSYHPPPGRHKIPAEVSLTQLGPHNVQSSARDTADFNLNPQGPDWYHVYTIVHASTVPRLPLLPPPKAENFIVYVTALRAWDTPKTDEALVMFASVAKQHLRRVKGYLVEHNDGFMLTAFKEPFLALQWALAVQADMLHAPWSTALLSHAVAEEILVPHVDALGNVSNIVLLRGPRIKAGMASGITKSEVHPATARIAYRGKVMNRAARIAATATSGQVLCDATTWESGAVDAGHPSDAAMAEGMTCLRLGEAQLKGIRDKIQLCQVHKTVEVGIHGAQPLDAEALGPGRVRQMPSMTFNPAFQSGRSKASFTSGPMSHFSLSSVHETPRGTPDSSARYQTTDEYLELNR